MDVIRAIERLNEIRNLKRELEREEENLRQSLASVVAAAGGRLVVGSYILALSHVETYQYGKIVSLIRSKHPELESEISELSEKFKTAYTRLTIERLS
jgi:(p)ppGpp synthase/HD superfamily hydrolase